MKADGKLGRNWLAGTHDDAVNALLVAASHNIRLLLNWLKCFYAVVVATIWAEVMTKTEQSYRQITA